MHKGKLAELYKQAHREVERTYYSSVVDPTITSTSVTRHFDHELFAELIVKECIQAVDNVGGYNEEFHMNAIKEHFGIEQ